MDRPKMLVIGAAIVAVLVIASMLVGPGGISVPGEQRIARKHYLSMSTIGSISAVVNRWLCSSEEIYDAFVDRLRRGLPTRDENARSLTSAYISFRSMRRAGRCLL
jgi:hypothetical protein